MINLKTIPTFGFEYKTCNADLARIVSYTNNNPEIKNLTTEERKDLATTNRIASTVFKLLGSLVPVLGGIIGVGRIYCALTSNNLPKEQLISEIARGVLELLGAGPILFMVDVGVTIFRAISGAPSNSEVPVQG